MFLLTESLGVQLSFIALLYERKQIKRIRTQENIKTLLIQLFLPVNIGELPCFLCNFFSVIIVPKLLSPFGFLCFHHFSDLHKPKKEKKTFCTRNKLDYFPVVSRGGHWRNVAHRSSMLKL